MEPNVRRLFRAGDGVPPPALTGRAAEQAVLSRCLADLRGNEAPPHNVVLVGPRGNGKTVLLRWFQSACEGNGSGVDVVSLTPSALADQAALLRALAPPTRLAKLLPRKIGIASVASAEWGTTDTENDLTKTLTVRCRRHPLAVLLDEAHALDLNVGAALLNASQQVRGAQAPFLLVLAGTPGLPAHLDRMDASFWSRLGEGELGIGRLSADAAKQALVEPLAAHGVDIDPNALEAVVAESQCYPYFVQLWGDALWQRLVETGTDAVTQEHVEAAQPVVSAQMANYYQRRFAELETEALMPAALAVAQFFKPDVETASDRDMDNALAAAGTNDADERHAQREALNRLGYIWRPPSQQPPFRWHPGIPSLMTYVLKQVAH